MDKRTESLLLSEITNSSVFILNKVRLFISRGDITECQEDMMVHFTNSDVDLSLSAIAALLAEKGGAKFQEACAELSVLEVGDVAVTNGYRLNCRDVIHCYCPVASSEKNRKKRYQNIITKCLVKTAALRYKSISIPCGSADSGYLDVDAAAKWIIEAIHDHCDLHARSSLRTVRVVIPQKDEVAQQSFDDTMFGLMPSRIADKHLSEVTDVGMVICNRVKLSIIKGSIGDSRDDVIVNSTGGKLDLTQGQVGPLLAKRAGAGLQKACTALAPLKVGDVAVTDGFNMSCSKIVHCNLPAYEDEVKTKSKVKDTVNKCLNVVSTNFLGSISFPAIGTGNLRYPAKLVAQWMVEAAIDYCDMFTRSSVSAINIVIYDKDTKTAEGFDEYMKGQVFKEVTDEHLLIYNRVRLDIIWQELASSIEDNVVANVVRDQVTKAIERKGGPVLIEARQRIDSLSVGSVMGVSASDMSCKQILFYHCATWDTSNEQALQSVVKSCLVKSASNGYRSIAFPPVGVSAEDYPPLVVCDSLVSAVADYVRTTPHSPLVTVKLYMPLEWTSVSQREDFKWSLRRRGCTKLIDGFNFVHNTKLSVVKGDLADTKADFILNSTGSHMSMAGGKSSLALLNKAGKALQEECDKHKPIITGDIVMTEGFGLPCKSVLHVCCPKRWINGETDQRLRELIMRCLVWADDYKAKSLALPAMGTGLLEYPPQSVARCVVHAVADFARLNRKSQLKSISLVLFHNDTDTIQGVEEAFGLDISAQQPNDPVDTSSSLTNGKIVVDLPTPWQNPVHEYREFSVVEGTREWQDVYKDFIKTLHRPTAVVLEILRIQNPQTYPLYDVMRKNVARKLNKQEHEVETAPLWHGTSEDCVAKITKTKFDRSRAAEGRKLGMGTYFSTSAKYSTNKAFSPPNEAGERFIILARVITGEYCLGNAKSTSATLYKGNSYEQYDSVVDDESAPTMYAVFHDASAYPEYVIKYKY